VVIDDFSRFTWVNSIREKSDTLDVFKDLGTQLQREKDSVIVRIRSDHGKEFENASHKRTSVATRDSGVDVDQSLHKSMIGSLLYLTTSRPDITFVVGVCVIYRAESKASHLTQVKRIMKYIILYSHDIDYILVGYCDVDWIGSAYDKKGHIRRIFLSRQQYIFRFQQEAKLWIFVYYRS
jgi:hypothetical protein